ncbi:DUF3201 domain-containing protein [Pyrococcus yayanosii]|uniref:DUF3201 domain-containing protein n=1 Tax=Pyrococcus yayanosii (strain CH1 / JCM 16557) TaxID=529709 RepID=F8AGU0_PYRYC|nr:DUF3201 domain-containing protein [Pyrococcus yayanosii]AEH25226.1 hypothetical protein PYCH_15600 [Pyrococcus yayanosii CH1]
MGTNLREVHKLLNRMWEGIFRLREELKEELTGFTVEDVEEVFNAYIYIDGEWREMKYPHPAFALKPYGEVGATIQGFYFVFAFEREAISKEFVRDFVRSFRRAFIYGAENFLEDFYNHERPKDPEEVFEDMMRTNEEVFNFEVDVSLDERELKEELKKFIELAKRHDLLG